MSDKRLGRGLEALLGPVSREQAEASGALREIALGNIRPNPFQPRTRLDEPALAELTASIEASGLLQPIVVRPRNGAYELIAGERRWRAAQRLGWRTIPAVVKNADDQTLLTLALIENLQRHDLSAIDEALGYQRLMDEFKVPQTEVARMVGRSRPAVANLLRLLRLPEDVRALVHEGKLSEGHARALLALDDPRAASSLAAEAAEQGFSVRDVEARVRGDAAATPAAAVTGLRLRKSREPHAATADARRVEDALRKRLGTDVRITAKRRGRGLVSISYYSNDDLARVLELILGEPFAG
jgi:ParB family chromosome partitioning protein